MKTKQSKQKPIVIDVEASGFGRGSYPIEVGFVLDTGETHCRLIQPLDNWTHWSEDAEKLHQVTRDILQTNGHDATNIANWLNEHLQGKTVYSDAWGNDMSWLGKLFSEVEIPQMFQLESIIKLLNPEALDLWNNTKDEILSADQIDRHRASHDAMLIQKTFMRLQSL